MAVASVLNLDGTILHQTSQDSGFYNLSIASSMITLCLEGEKIIQICYFFLPVPYLVVDVSIRHHQLQKKGL